MTTLAYIAPKLQKLIPLLASDKDGEVLAAVGAIRRVLGAAGADLHDLAEVISAQSDNPYDLAYERLKRIDAEREVVALRRRLSSMKEPHPLAMNWWDPDDAPEGAAQCLSYPEALTSW